MFPDFHEYLLAGTHSLTLSLLSNRPKTGRNDYDIYAGGASMLGRFNGVKSCFGDVLIELSKFKISKIC